MVTVCPSQFATRRTLFHVLVRCGLLLFFFSSRRRHTRCLSDWSSDVCSSDLGAFTWVWPTFAATSVGDLRVDTEVYDPQFSWDAVPGAAKYELEINPTQDFTRSEERRVGKECRSRWAREHAQQNGTATTGDRK